MPVISSRRSSYSYLTPSTTSSSTSSSSIGIGTYRSSYLSSSSSSSSDTPKSSSYLSSRRDRDLDTTTSSSSGYTSSRYGTPSSSSSNITGASILSRYRSSALESSSDYEKPPSSSTASSYRSSRYYDFDSTSADDKPKRSYDTSTSSSSLSSSSYLNGSSSGSSSTLSSRIGVSSQAPTDNHYHPSTLPPLTNTSSHTKRSTSRLRDQQDTCDSAKKVVDSAERDFYEKYSPSRYKTKFEVERTRSLSEASQSPSTQHHHIASTNNPSANTRSEIRSVALRNTLPTSSTKIWDRDYTSSYSSRSTLGDTKIGDKKETSSSRYESSSYAAGGNRSSAISPSKTSLANDYDRKNSSSTQSVEGLCGLWNIGNTCFMNSVLQCLSATADLSKFARSSSASSSVTEGDAPSKGKDKKIWDEFCKLLHQMWQSGTKSVNPSDLKFALSSKYRMYSGSAQQDAQEFLRYLLDALHGALNKGGQRISLKIDDDMSDLEKANVTWEWYNKRENSRIKDLFVGQLKSSLHCTHCEKTSVVYDPFWDLSVPVPSTPNCKLDKCLEAFTVKDVLDGVEMPYCDYCKTTRKCIKWFTIQKFPKYLVIHLKRFSEMRWTKLTNIVDFPTGVAELDLTPYAADSMDKSEPKPIYSLYAISNHMGSTHGGHYVASCKHSKNRKWYEFNDNFVSESRESSLVSSSAYLLFYERVDSKDDDSS